MKFGPLIEIKCIKFLHLAPKLGLLLALCLLGSPQVFGQKRAGPGGGSGGANTELAVQLSIMRIQKEISGWPQYKKDKLRFDWDQFVKLDLTGKVLCLNPQGVEELKSTPNYKEGWIKIQPLKAHVWADEPQYIYIDCSKGNEVFWDRVTSGTSSLLNAFLIHEVLHTIGAELGYGDYSKSISYIEAIEAEEANIKAWLRKALEVATHEIVPGPYRTMQIGTCKIVITTTRIKDEYQRYVLEWIEKASPKELHLMNLTPIDAIRLFYFREDMPGPVQAVSMTEIFHYAPREFVFGTTDLRWINADDIEKYLVDNKPFSNFEGFSSKERERFIKEWQDFRSRLFQEIKKHNCAGN